jgi:hypothetical protein
MDSTTVVTKNPQAAFRSLAAGQGAVVLMLDSGQYHGLNEVGTAIWDLIDGRRTVSGIAQGLRAQLDDPPADLDVAVQQFLDDLNARQLVRGVTANGVDRS